MKTVAGLMFVFALGVAAWCGAHRVVGHPVTRAVGTHPGGVRRGVELDAFQPAAGDELVAFSSGCFWGSEEAFRKMPGLVATAVGYTGGTSVDPSYEEAHRTGQLETVLIEFDPRRTPFSSLLSTFWKLPRSEVDAATSSSSHGAAIWTYDGSELGAANASVLAVQGKLGYKVRVEVRPAMAFYLAEEYHQQYDEKAGRELCPAVP